MKFFFNSIALKTAVLALVTLTLFFLAYLPVFQILLNVWIESEEYSHAFLVLPIILYMVWSRRAVFQENQIRYPAVGLVLLVVSTLFYPIALLSQMRTVIAFSMFLTVIGAIVYLAGAKTLKELYTPLLLLVMLIPVPNQFFIQITFPLQLKVSQISEVLVQFFEVAIFREGNVMNIPGRSFEVVRACSGLRSMIVLVTLSVIMGYFMLQKLSSKLILVVASVPTAIFVNIIRVTGMILLFHYYKLDLSNGVLHTATGLLIFSIAMLTLFALLKVLGLWEKKSNSS